MTLRCLESFNIQGRSAIIDAMTADPCDLIVIGGGITGASIFRDAAQRGLRAALIEAHDFASGTSSRSSKLIHGGLRYLKNLGFRLAWESCHERNLHVRLNRRLVKPVPFLVPLYRHEKPSRLSMRLGMALYEALGGLRNHRFHRFISREETLLLAPGIPVTGLSGSVVYYDAMVNDSRWTIEVVKDGVRHGGLALNHAPVTQMVKSAGRICGVAATDSIGKREFTVNSALVINAAGVCCDRIRALDDPAASPLVRVSRGTHLVFRAEDIPLNISTVFPSRLGGRSLFLVQRDGSFLYGTTDDWTDDQPDHPVPHAADVRYLVESLEAFMPECAPVLEKVRHVYSGFRPLIAQGSPGRSPSASTRDDLIETSQAGLVTVVGGKLTTARAMAQRVLKHVAPRLRPQAPLRPCATATTPIGGDNEQVAEGLAQWVRACPKLADYIRILFERYGLDAHRICPEATAIALGRHPDPLAEPIRAEVKYVCRHEMVCNVEDLIERRAGFLHWDAETRIERLHHGARMICEELGIGAEEFQNQVAAYGQYLATFHAIPAG